MEIKNKALRTALNAAGLQQYRLWKDNGYFHVYTDDDDLALALTHVTTSIYVCRFTDQSVDDWVRDIREIHNSIAS